MTLLATSLGDGLMALAWGVGILGVGVAVGLVFEGRFGGRR